MRKWEKVVADGNVEQMFGMNIKQEGIEVLGDQVRCRVVQFKTWTSSILQDNQLTLKYAGRFRSLDSRLASNFGTPARFLRRSDARGRAGGARRRLHRWTLRLCHFALVGQVQDLLRAVR